MAQVLFHDLELEGPGTDRVTWAAEIAPEVKAASPILVIGCGMEGIHTAIRLRDAGLPSTIVEKSEGARRVEGLVDGFDGECDNPWAVGAGVASAGVRA